jgi:hypothetical protein
MSKFYPTAGDRVAIRSATPSEPRGHRSFPKTWRCSRIVAQPYLDAISAIISFAATQARPNWGRHNRDERGWDFRTESRRLVVIAGALPVGLKQRRRKGAPSRRRRSRSRSVGLRRCRKFRLPLHRGPSDTAVPTGSATGQRGIDRPRGK